MSKDTILILDEEFHTQWTLKTLLESEKYIVLAVDTIERALQNFQEFEISGLVTEYRVDHSTTVDIIRELKKSFPELYVMMLTYENLEAKEYRRIMSSGIGDLFLKPIPADRILIHLKKGLMHRRMLIEKKRLEKKLYEARKGRDDRVAGLNSARPLSQNKHSL